MSRDCASWAQAGSCSWERCPRPHVVAPGMLVGATQLEEGCAREKDCRTSRQLSCQNHATGVIDTSAGRTCPAGRQRNEEA